MDRAWYLMLRDGDETVIDLIGPFTGGEQIARAAMAQMLATDAYLATHVDWEHPAVVVPYFYHSLEVVDLDPDEVKAVLPHA